MKHIKAIGIGLIPITIGTSIACLFLFILDLAKSYDLLGYAYFVLITITVLLLAYGLGLNLTEDN